MLGRFGEILLRKIQVRRTKGLTWISIAPTQSGRVSSSGHANRARSIYRIVPPTVSVYGHVVLSAQGNSNAEIGGQMFLVDARLSNAFKVIE